MPEVANSYMEQKTNVWDVSDDAPRWLFETSYVSCYDSLITLNSMEVEQGQPMQLYDIESDRLLDIPDEIGIDSSEMLIKGDHLYYIHENALTRYDVVTQQVQSLFQVDGMETYKACFCLVDDIIYLLDRTNNQLWIYSLVSYKVEGQVEISNDAAIAGIYTFAVSNGYMLTCDSDDAMLYLTRLDTGELTTFRLK